jgi:hypothetical protein
MEMQRESYGFKKDFAYEGTHFSIHVIPYIIANETDKMNFHLAEGEFLVHLFDEASFKSFSVFYNEKLEWDSDVSKLVLDDNDLIETIGFLIDDYYA